MRFAFLLVALTAPTLWAQTAAPSPVTWTATASRESVRPGERFTVTLAARITPGWKIYAMDTRAGRPLSVRFDALPTGLALRGTPQQSDPRQGYDENFRADVSYFERAAQVTADVDVQRGAPRATTVVRGTTTFMACSSSLCLPPKQVPFEVAVRVVR